MHKKKKTTSERGFSFFFQSSFLSFSLDFDKRVHVKVIFPLYITKRSSQFVKACLISLKLLMVK